MRWRSTAPLLLLLTGWSAAAGCIVGPTTSVLAVEGFGVAYYQEARTDNAADLVEFYGGVCVVGEGEQWTVEADRVVISGLRGGLSLSAEPATVEVAGWRLDAALLNATRERLDMQSPRLSGPGLDGTALSATMNLVTGDVMLQELMLQSTSLIARGKQARLLGGELTIDEPTVTSCTCPGRPFFYIDGTRASVDLGGSELTLTGGVLHVGGVAVSLADPIELSEETLAELTLPLAVDYVPDQPGRKGTGLGVLLRPIPLTDGLSGEFGASGIDLQYPLRAVALLTGTTSTATVTLGQQSDGLRFEVATQHALTPWLEGGFDVRLLDRSIRDGLKEGVVHVRAHTPLPTWRGEVSAAAFAAASVQEPASGQVAGARLGLSLDAAAATVAGPSGRLSLKTRVELTGYPDAMPPGSVHPGLLQWGVELTPEWNYASGPFTARASYLARWTNSASPFTTELDRLTPTQRLSLRTTVAGALAPGVTASLEARGVYDLISHDNVAAGFNALDVTTTVNQELADWTVGVGLEARLAGVIAPNGQRVGQAVASLNAQRRPARGIVGIEFHARTRMLWEPDPTGLDLLELSAAVPVVLPGVVLRPYLAVDFAPSVLRAQLPAISGHGIDVTFETCCGAFTVGYRNEENVWSASFAIDLERRPATPQSAAADVSGSIACEGNEDEASARPEPEACVVPSTDAPGIMVGAAGG